MKNRPQPLAGPARRSWLRDAATLVCLAAVPLPLAAAPDDVAAARRTDFGDVPLQEGRVRLTLPALAENGNSVALSIDVDSPMTAADHVVAIHVFAEKNPLPKIAEFRLGPLSGRASVSTRIRLADTQKVIAVAELSNGELFSAAAETVVTQAACLDFLI